MMDSQSSVKSVRVEWASLGVSARFDSLAFRPLSEYQITIVRQQVD